MKKVWGLTTGKYSDYRVEVLFENEEAARALVGQSSGGRYGHEKFEPLEEFLLVEKGDVVEKHEVYQYSAFLDTARGFVAKGHVGPLLTQEGPDIVVWTEWSFDDTAAQVKISKRPVVTVRNSPRGGGYYLDVRGLDETGVRKSFTDTVAQWRAQGYVLNRGEDHA